MYHAIIHNALVCVKVLRPISKLRLVQRLVRQILHIVPQRYILSIVHLDGQTQLLGQKVIGLVLLKVLNRSKSDSGEGHGGLEVELGREDVVDVLSGCTSN